MSSIPSVSINPGSTAIYPSLYYPTPQVISATALTPSAYIPYATVPTVASVANLSNYPPFAPLYPSVVTYPDINSDRNLKQQVTEYFFEKVLKNWLRYHYLELYPLVVVSGGVASLVKDFKQAESNTKSDQTTDGIKYEFIVDNFLTKKDVFALLSKFRKINGLNWWDLKQHSDKVRKFIQYKVLKYMKKQIMSKK